MSEVNIDADLVAAAVPNSSIPKKLWWKCRMAASAVPEEMIFCLRSTSLKKAGSIIFWIRSTGISELLPVATTFDFRDESGQNLSDIARLDTMVTVVDAVNLPRDFASHDALADRGEAVLGDEDERTLVHLLTDQIEFMDVIVINKGGDAGPDGLSGASNRPKPQRRCARNRNRFRRGSSRSDSRYRLVRF